MSQHIPAPRGRACPYWVADEPHPGVCEFCRWLEFTGSGTYWVTPDGRRFAQWRPAFGSVDLADIDYLKSRAGDLGLVLRVREDPEWVGLNSEVLVWGVYSSHRAVATVARQGRNRRASARRRKVRA